MARRTARQTSKPKQFFTLQAKVSARSREWMEKTGYRNKAEEGIARAFEDHGFKPNYESVKLAYTVPESEHTYTPDFPFPVLPEGKRKKAKRVFIEVKGWPFEAADRQKLINVAASNPDVEIRIVFSRAATPIYKGSKTTYGDWASKNGFKWADKHIPQEWWNECIGFEAG